MTAGAAYWDNQAATFDEQPDHGLRDPHVRAAWEQLLLPRLPPAPAMVADLGCGTGSLSVLLDGRAAGRYPRAQCWPRLLRMLLPASSVRATCE